MADEKSRNKVTTLRVRTSTRDAVNALAEKKKVSVEELILQLMKKDMAKQILVTVDNKKYDMMVYAAKLLKNTNYTSSDRLDDMLLWAFDYTMRDVRQHIDSMRVLPTQTTTNGSYGQPKEAHTT